MKEKVAAFTDFAASNYGGQKLFQAHRPEECEFAKALAHFHAAGQLEREAVRATLSDPYSAHYFANFAVRCASFALQSNDGESLRHGVLALVIDADVLDPRDLVGALGVLDEAATRLGINLFRQVMAPVIEIATHSRRKLIEDFFFHPETEKSIGKLGFEFVHIEGLPWFRFQHG